MPNFIRTKNQEKRWSKAKRAAEKSKGKTEESFSDRDWALVNSIYQKLSKSVHDAFGSKDIEYLKKIRDTLLQTLDKADGRDYDKDPEDEYDPPQDEYEIPQDEYDIPQDEDQDLEQEYKNLPEEQKVNIPKDYDVAFPNPDEDLLRQTSDHVLHMNRWIDSLDRHNSDPEKNPILAGKGVVERAHAQMSKDAQNIEKQLESVRSSPEYKQASPIRQRRMLAQERERISQQGEESNFKSNFNLSNQAFKEHRKAELTHVEKQLEDLKSLLDPKASTDDVSFAEALQSFGIDKDEGGAVAIKRDPGFKTLTDEQKQKAQQQIARLEGRRKKLQDHIKSHDQHGDADISFDKKAALDAIYANNPHINDKKAKNAVGGFIEKYIPLAKIIKGRMMNSMNLSEDFKNHFRDAEPENAVITPAMYKALKKWDPNRGVKFRTFFSHVVKGELHKEVKKMADQFQISQAQRKITEQKKQPASTELAPREVKPKTKVAPPKASSKAQTVEEFLAAGGKIKKIPEQKTEPESQPNVEVPQASTVSMPTPAPAPEVKEKPASSMDKASPDIQKRFKQVSVLKRQFKG